MPSAVVWDLTQGFVPQAPAAAGTIGIGVSIAPNEVIDLKVDGGLDHIVQKDSLAFDQEMVCAREIVSSPCSFLDRPLEVIFGREQPESIFTDFRETVVAGEKKKAVLARLDEFLHGLTGARAIRDDAMMVADELFTNGAKNGAPLVGEVDAASVNAGEIHFVARGDGRRLVLGCIDSYGTLEVGALTRKIQGIYRKGVASSINHGPGGAGIGSYMVFNSSISLYLGVEKGRRTVVLCSLPLSMRVKETITLSKNLHVVEIG